MLSPFIASWRLFKDLCMTDSNLLKRSISFFRKGIKTEWIRGSYPELKKRERECDVYRGKEVCLRYAGFQVGRSPYILIMVGRYFLEKSR